MLKDFSHFCLLAIKLGLILTLSGCNDEPKAVSQLKPQSVSVQRLIEVDSYTLTQEYTGTIRAANTTEIGFELNGKINKILVDSGVQVTKGQVLAELDTQLLQAQQQEIHASLLQNKADLTLAKASLQRSQELSGQGYVSSQELDESKGKVDSLIAARNRLNASLRAVELKIAKSKLVSPFDASIGQRQANLGEVVNLGKPVFTLIQNNRPQAHIGIPINLSQQFKLEEKLALKVANTQYVAKVLGISSQVNPITRTQTLRLALPQDANVINGELAYLAYQQVIPRKGFWVPISALTQGMRGRWNLFIAQASEKDTKEHQIGKRDVEIIFTNEHMAFISGAISKNEYYIDKGLHKLVAGQNVAPIAQQAKR